MKSLLITDDSNTTKAEEGVRYLEYYQGSFRQIRDLAIQLSKVSQVTTIINSSDFGLVKGDDVVGDSSLSHQASRSEEPLVELFSEADIVGIFLTSDSFQSLIRANWDSIVTNSTQVKLWCIGVSKSEIESTPISVLERNESSVITYPRVGVARIGNQTKSEFIAQSKSISQ